ncbi:MAG: PilT/PilU family type 4a pilus ATPase [Candidatus Pacebacteria bacterium]|nr:PilT/PilU family type 4a pilus ATPase [Candidatus Paceibacterota bacterium]MCF7857490.1 PilT/PilU family type 4a pilus ATPase [Candidatus Paceibacterota bacterium]
MSTVDYKRELEDLIDIVATEKGSDIHLSVGGHPVIRVDGSLIHLEKKPILTNADVEGFMHVLLTKEQEEKFIETREIDFSYAAKDGVRFRGNGFFQKGAISVALRHISKEIKNFDELALPAVLESFTQRPQGFFLCVGPVGQGKSTTLAAMIELINQTRAEHIMTIEDPIEYIFEPKKSLIDQREVRVDTADFHTGLHSAFRQDVDVIMVGEMRGRDTISTAVTAAETGHLVLSTLHTNDAAQTIDRIIDTFPASQQDQIRVQLSGSLTAIFSQRLIPRISGGLVPAFELLINNTAVSNLIRERRTHEIQTVIETGMDIGMIDMNRTLVELVQQGEITVENAFAYSTNPKGLERLM